MYWSLHLCRICASVGSQTYQIFNNKNVDIEINIKKCFATNIYKDDFKPKEICHTCLLKLNEFIVFQQLFIASNNKFESILYQNNRTTELQDNWQNLATELFSPSESSVIVKAEDLITQYKNEINSLNMTTNAINANITQLTNAINADVATINTTNLATIAADVINNHPLNGDINILDTTQLSDVLVFDALPSNQTVLRHSSDFYTKAKNYQRLENIQSDVQFNYDKNLEPNATVFDDFSKIDYNADAINNLETQITKKDEIKATNDTDTKNLKVDANAAKARFACTHCDKTFVRKLSLKTHMSVHTKIRPYQCKICNKSFTIRCELTCHLKIHANTYQCKYCLKSFAVASKLERHIRIHTNIRPYKCDKCDKSFTDKRNLVGHQVTHTNVRDFFCGVCKKGYKTKMQLKDHQKAHSDVCYKCDMCDKKFKWKTNLIGHVKKHTEYFCKKCQLDFPDSAAHLLHKGKCL